MGLFSIYNKKNANGKTLEKPARAIDSDKLDIPENIFIDNSDPGISSNTDINGDDLIKDLNSIYEFLQEDYESRGYNDALTNPDLSYKNDNILLLKQDLFIRIQKVTTIYEDQIRKIDFHITTRERDGLIDIVEELKSRKETITEHMSKVKEVKNNTENDQGMYQRMILSYKRGFSKGLAAITQSEIFNK